MKALAPYDWFVASSDFELEIADQGWLGSLSDEEAEHDLCSHGRIRLSIGGRTIDPGDKYEWGISETALGLLRTLESDHSPERPVTERLIPCGCGAILMMNCGIGIDWSVRHTAERVRVADVVRYDVPGSNAQPVLFPGVSAELAVEEYRRQVVSFAITAKAPFAGVERRFDDEDDFDRQQFERFWEEYDELLS